MKTLFEQIQELPAGTKLDNVQVTWGAKLNWVPLRSYFYGHSLTETDDCGVELRVKPKAHPHAELMKLYAEDAAMSETPWENWERKDGSKWRSMYGNPTWSSLIKYRRKPS